MSLPVQLAMCLSEFLDEFYEPVDEDACNRQILLVDREEVASVGDFQLYDLPC